MYNVRKKRPIILNRVSCKVLLPLHIKFEYNNEYYILNKFYLNKKRQEEKRHGYTYV